MSFVGSFLGEHIDIFCGNQKNRNFHKHEKIWSAALEDAYIDVKTQHTDIKQKNHKCFYSYK